MIQLGVVKPVQEMNGTRSRCGETQTDLTSEFSMGRRHERRHFFMTDLHIFETSRIDLALKRHIDPARAVSGIAIGPFQTPFLKAFPHELADIHGHGVNAPMCDDLMRKRLTGRECSIPAAVKLSFVHEVA